MATCLSIAAPFLKTFSGTHLFINYKCRTSYKSFAINFKRCLARIPYTTTYIPASILVYSYTTATATTPACLLLLKKQRLLSACLLLFPAVCPARTDDRVQKTEATSVFRPPEKRKTEVASVFSEKQRWPLFFEERGYACMTWIFACGIFIFIYFCCCCYQQIGEYCLLTAMFQLSRLLYIFELFM